MANANTNFGNALFKILAKPDQNLIMSSYSVSSVLNMALNGAKGRTASQIKQGLTIKDFDVVKNGFKDILTLLKSNESFTLNAANRIYFSVDNSIDKSYIQSTQKFFLAEPMGMDFRQAEQSRNEINQWVDEQTNQKIQDLIAPGSIDGDTKLVLVNAVYFKGDWQFKFNKTNTKKDEFHVSPSQTVQTDMMFSLGTFGVLRGIKDLKGADALDMPYKGKRLSMIFLLPGIDGLGRDSSYAPPSYRSLDDLEDAMSKVTDLNSILKFEQKLAVKVTLPRFKLESELDLDEPLMQLGMTDMFGRDADFSGMTGGTNTGLYVSKVLQKVFVEVNEEGTEAAAATFATFNTRMAPRIPEFTCLRPFMFLIRDNLTGMILFSGHVTDPSNKTI